MEMRDWRSPSFGLSWLRMLPLFVVLCCLCLCAVGCASSSGESEGAFEARIVKKAQDQLQSETEAVSWNEPNEEVLDADKPACEKVSELPDADHMYMYADSYKSEGPYWCVSFTTTADAVLGTIDYYFDSEGTLIGSPLRD